MGNDTPAEAGHQLARTLSTWRCTGIGGLNTMSSAMLAEACVPNAFTLRPDDLRVVGGSDARRAADRRECLCQALGGDPALLTWMEQVHGHAIAVIDRTHAGRQIDGADGLVTDQQGVTLMALSADCPVVTVADPGRAVLGIAHAGWRGTIRGITRSLVQVMVRRFACRPGDLLATVSPSAGPERYLVGDDVRQQARRHLSDPDRFLIRRGESLVFDLWSANVAQLIEAGLEPERIDLARMCTISDERFFSYRRDGPATGHAAMLAALG